MRGNVNEASGTEDLQEPLPLPPLQPPGFAEATPGEQASRLKPGRLVVISGPSGVGKSTISQRVADRTGAMLSVSATTRGPRGREADRREYRFLDVPTFKGMIEQGQLLEWAEVFGHYYGTPAEPVESALKAGQTVILTIDVQGGIQVAAKRPEAVGILIVPPSRQELRRRLAGRATEAAEALEKRLCQANKELAMARQSGAYRHEVMNDSLDAAVERVTAIVEQETQRHDRSA